MAELSTKSNAVATHHPAGADAAAKIFVQGGNAIDAAVAAMLALCVVLPGSVGIGGYGGSMVVYLAKRRKTIALDFDSRAPLAFRPELFKNPQAAEIGYLAISVPAVISGLATALREYGTKSWADVSAPAIELAENGFPIDAWNKKHLTDFAQKTDPASLRTLFRDGRIPDLGAPWVQKDLAGMLRQMAEKGPEIFYTGEIMRRIVHQIHANGGILTEKDFTDYKPAIVEPISATYRGYEVQTPPPPSGGITLLQILKTLEQFDIAKMAPWKAPYLHLFAETCKLCFADRAKYLGDPDFVKIPVEMFLSETRAKELGQQLKTSEHTSNVSTLDKQGNVVSVTCTQGYQFGSQVVIDGLGLVMAHGMSRFTFDPSSPNFPAPGKRVFHNMAPTIIAQNESKIPRYAMGLPGGPKIITVTAQLAINQIDFGCNAHDSVYAPRIHIDGPEPLAVSHSLPLEVNAELEKLGHKIIRGQQVGGPSNEIGGPANIIAIDPKTRDVQAVSGAGPDAAKII